VLSELVEWAANWLRFSMFTICQIREYHRRHPAARVVDANEEYETLLKEEPQIEFSGEVGVSRCFSLHIDI
jgi:hypothetical protein